MELTTPDRLLDEHNVVQIDHLTLAIEGEEINALRGLDSDRFKPSLHFLETASNEILSYIEDHDYRLIGKYRMAGMVNFYFCPNALSTAN